MVTRGWIAAVGARVTGAMCPAVVGGVDRAWGSNGNGGARRHMSDAPTGATRRTLHATTLEDMTRRRRSRGGTEVELVDSRGDGSNVGGSKGSRRRRSGSHGGRVTKGASGGFANEVGPSMDGVYEVVVLLLIYATVGDAPMEDIILK